MKAIDVNRLPEYAIFIEDQAFFDNFEGGAFADARGMHLPGGLVVINGQHPNATASQPVAIAPIINNGDGTITINEQGGGPITQNFAIGDFAPHDFSVIDLIEEEGLTTRYIVAKDTEGNIHLWHTDGTKVTKTLEDGTVIDRFVPCDTLIPLGVDEDYVGYVSTNGEISMLDKMEFQASVLHCICTPLRQKEVLKQKKLDYASCFSPSALNVYFLTLLLLFTRYAPRPLPYI